MLTCPLWPALTQGLVSSAVELMVLTHSSLVFQPSAFLMLVSSFSSVHQGSEHTDGSAKI